MIRFAALTLFGFLATGCSKCSPTTPEASAPLREDLFPYANVSRRPAELPARFRARLPSTLEEFDGDWSAFPPRGQAEQALCRGEPSMVVRWLEAVSRAATPIEPALRDRFAGMTTSCDGEAFCAPVLHALASASPNTRPVLLATLTHCAGEDARAAIEAGAEHAYVVDWYLARDQRFATLGERLQRAARALVATQHGKALRSLGVALGRFDDPKLSPFVRELGAGTDPVSRAWLSLGACELQTAEAKDLCTATCAKLEHEPLCEPDPPWLTAFAAKPPSGPLAEQVRSPAFDPAAWLAAHPTARDELREATSACARELPERCLRHWATLDREGAAAFARTLPAKAEPRVLIANLVQYPTAVALDEEVRRWAVTTPSREPDRELTLVERLLGAGRVHGFDVETGTFPNEHDALLVALAARAGSELADVAFEEVSPGDPDEQRPYVLRAYRNGQLFEVEAANYGDWYDVEAVLGLLNTLLREQRSELRYALVDSAGQFAYALCAPKDDLLRSARAGVLQLEDPNRAMREAKAAEQKVEQQLFE